MPKTDFKADESTFKLMDDFLVVGVCNSEVNIDDLDLI
jgi:hypothetical protein